MKFVKFQIEFFHKDRLFTLTSEEGSFEEARGMIDVEFHQRENRIGLDLHPREEVTLKSVSLYLSPEIQKADKIFVNGFQTWTDSREFSVNENLPGLSPLTKPINNRYKLAYYGDYHFWPYPNKPGLTHSHTFSYWRKGNEIDFVGSISEKSGFTIVESNFDEQEVVVKKDCDGLELHQSFKAFDLYLEKGDYGEIWEKYFREHNLAKPKNKPVSGWTSWYNHYTNINEKIVLKNLASFADNNVPIDLIQIDDGYQLAIGDWMPNEKFNGGMRSLTDKIHAKGYKAGLWMAPFICEEKSFILEKNPDWIRKDKNGKNVVAGFSTLWSGRFYALDIENPAVRNHIRTHINRMLNDWNFDLLKLDFLSALAIDPSTSKTRGAMMRYGMEFLREVMGDKLMLACGVPLGSAFGLADYCRIGADVALKWEDNFLKNVLRYRERVSTQVSLNCTISRAMMDNRFFMNDPDVYILRDKNCKMDKVQKETLFLLNQCLGSLLFMSDDVDTYKPAVLNLFKKQFPLPEKNILNVEQIGEAYRITFEIGEHSYLIVANLSAKGIEMKLPKAVYFEGGEFYKRNISLKAYESKCLKIFRNEPYEILGSDGHIFPASEIEKFEVTGNKISIERNEFSVKNCSVWIAVPESDAEYFVNGYSVVSKDFYGRGVVEAHYGL